MLDVEVALVTPSGILPEEFKGGQDEVSELPDIGSHDLICGGIVRPLRC